MVFYADHSSTLWSGGTADMANRKKRIPKLDDRVAVLGHTGAFVISSVDGDLRTVELKPIGTHFALSTIPWRTLMFLDEEDKAS
jgi:hypothetical protein